MRSIFNNLLANLGFLTGAITRALQRWSSTARWPQRCSLRVVIGCLVVMVLATAPWVRGDVVILKNGDRVSGVVTLVTPLRVTIHSRYLGTLTIARSHIRTILAQQWVHVINEDNTLSKAYILPAQNGGGWVLSRLPPSPTLVQLVAPPAAGKAVKKHKPLSLFGPYWDNQLILGLTNTTGNTNQTEFTAGVKFHYKHALNEITVDFDGGYGKTNGYVDTSYAGADVIYRGTIPQFQPYNRWYAYAENHDLYDGIRGISYRTLDSVGLGYYILKSKKLEVDVRSGPGFIYERFFHGGSVSAPTASGGLRAVYKIDDRISLTENGLATVSLLQAGDFQATSITALHIALPEISRGLGLLTSFEDDYDNTALRTTARPNDTRFIVGATLNF
ncbi:MAG: DUF481 domain-containing protein [Phycisphaerales bacterium]|nr:DUF481 domain-containing protein [Phycisphaerales bacterium]